MKILINAALIIALEQLLFCEYPSAALPKLNFLMCADLHIGSLLLLRGMSTTQTTQQAASFFKSDLEIGLVPLGLSRVYTLC